jgi:CRISPR-associated protein Csx14
MTVINESTLICTLGGQPQIATFALDWLLSRGEQVRDLIALHLDPADERLGRSLERLQTEFDGDQYQGQACRFRAVPLRQGADILPAIRTEAEAEIVRQTVFSLITDLKQAGRTLHLCLAGGPRLMALMALSSAQLHCGHQDKIWHIYTEPELLAQAQEGAVMHDEQRERVWLVPVPTVPWGQYFSMFATNRESPAEAMQVQTNWLDQTELRRCETVWSDLTTREREVVIAFAGGANPQEVAEQLVISIKTVSSHQTNIFTKCRPVWELPLDHRFSFHFLRDKFKPFLNSLP